MKDIVKNAFNSFSIEAESLAETAKVLDENEFAKAVEKYGDESMCFSTSQELSDWLTVNPLEGAAVLIKGSRGTRMEKVIPVL